MSLAVWKHNGYVKQRLTRQLNLHGRRGRSMGSGAALGQELAIKSVDFSKSYEMGIAVVQYKARFALDDNAPVALRDTEGDTNGPIFQALQALSKDKAAKLSTLTFGTNFKKEGA